MNTCKLVLSFLLLSCPLHAGWLERKAEGWAWYEDEEPKEEVFEEKSETTLEQMERVKKELETLLAVAILNPSQENVLRYMEAQKTWLGKSSDFSQQWAKLLLGNPHLDPTATTYATAQYGRQLQKAIEQEEKENLIRTVSMKFGLFFFYEGGSKSSVAFSHVVRAFAHKYQWTLIGISTDGIAIPEIQTIEDKGVGEKFNITIYPALIAFDHVNQTIVPISFGLKSIDQIENNIYLQFKETKHD